MPRPRLLIALLVLGGCSKKEPAPTNKEPSSATTGSAMAASGSAAAGSASAGSATATPKPAGPRGRAAPDNRKALVDLATAAESCKVDPAYPRNSCNDQVKAFSAAFDKEKDIATLVNLLEDPSAQVRFLAVRTFLDLMLMRARPSLPTRRSAA